MKLYNNDILPYINNNFTELQYNHITLSNYSNIIIEKLIRHILIGIEKHKTSDINYKKLSLTSNDFPIPSEFNYYPDKIKQHISHIDKVGSEITFNIKGRIIHVYVICEKNIQNITRQIRKIIKLIYIWLYVISDFADSKCSQTLDIYLYLTSLTKNMNNNPLNRTHVNTAFTTSCTTSTVINIFRYEEWFKTFIHETFHSFGLDFSNHNNDIITNKINSLYPCIKDVKLFEAYTELWAEIINIIFIEIFFTKQYNTLDNILLKIPKMLKNINKMITEQFIFSLFQTSKILSHYKLSYPTMLTTNSIKLYNEETPVFSYYIIKTLLLSNINSFITWCSNNNHFSISFNNYTKNDTPNKKMNRFFNDIILPIYNKDILFINNLSYIQNKMKSLNKKNPLFTTLRHSIHDI